MRLGLLLRSRCLYRLDESFELCVQYLQLLHHIFVAAAFGRGFGVAMGLVLPFGIAVSGTPRRRIACLYETISAKYRFAAHGLERDFARFSALGTGGLVMRDWSA